MQDSYNKEIKIGIAKCPKSRALNMKTARPNIEIVFTKKCQDLEIARRYEKNLHAIFQEYSIGGEWFSGNAPILEFVQKDMMKAYSYRKKTVLGKPLIKKHPNPKSNAVKEPKGKPIRQNTPKVGAPDWWIFPELKTTQRKAYTKSEANRVTLGYDRNQP